jgi:hypothetical protein
MDRLLFRLDCKTMAKVHNLHNLIVFMCISVHTSEVAPAPFRLTRLNLEYIVLSDTEALVHGTHCTGESPLEIKILKFTKNVTYSFTHYIRYHPGLKRS